MCLDDSKLGTSPEEPGHGLIVLSLLSQLAEMEEELRYAPLSFRNPMMSKLRNYRKDLAKLHREVRSTPLTAPPGSRGDMKHGAYAIENEHVVSCCSVQGSERRGSPYCGVQLSGPYTLGFLVCTFISFLSSPCVPTLARQVFINHVHILFISMLNA